MPHQDYRITGFGENPPNAWDDNYGNTNVQYDCFVDDGSGEDQLVQVSRRDSSPEPQVGEVIYGHLEQPNPDYPPKLKTDKKPDGGGQRQSRPAGAPAARSGGGSASKGGGFKGGWSPEDLRAVRQSTGHLHALLYQLVKIWKPDVTLDDIRRDSLWFAEEVEKAAKAQAPTPSAPAQSTAPAPRPAPAPQTDIPGDDFQPATAPSDDIPF